MQEEEQFLGDGKILLAGYFWYDERVHAEQTLPSKFSDLTDARLCKVIKQVARI